MKYRFCAVFASLIIPYLCINFILHQPFNLSCLLAWGLATLDHLASRRIREKAINKDTPNFFKYVLGFNSLKFLFIFILFIILISHSDFQHNILITFFIAYFSFLIYDVAWLKKLNGSTGSPS